LQTIIEKQLAKQKTITTMSSNVINGHAFEYAIAETYISEIRRVNENILVNPIIDVSYERAKECFYSLNVDEQEKYILSAQVTFPTIHHLEPNLTNQTSDLDILNVRINDSVSGQSGDVRDIIFSRKGWEFGISAKNNNDAVKHPRISNDINFCESWMDENHLSPKYKAQIHLVFHHLSAFIGRGWDSVDFDKDLYVYMPILDAFKLEMERILNLYPYLCANLLRFMIGKHSFYKIIKNKKSVLIKAFKMTNDLNRKSQQSIQVLTMPTRIIEMSYKEKSTNTLILTMDEGWQISFRLHNASSRIEKSLKFDIRLIGNPPEIFNQHLFT